MSPPVDAASPREHLMVNRCLPTLKRIALVTSTVLASACAPLQPPGAQAPATASVETTWGPSTSPPDRTPLATPAAETGSSSN